MARFIRGITLTPEERLQTGIFPGSNRTPVLHSHTCSVTLPDGTTCSVNYLRLNPRSHKFLFLGPIHEQIWIDPMLDGSIAVVEAKAQEVAAEAFRKAQSGEKQKRRRRTTRTMSNATVQNGSDAPLSAKNASRYAGKYAVCLKLSNDALLRVGPLVDTPEQLRVEMGLLRYRELLQAGQRLAVGICDRSLRRWVEPEFLAERFPEPTKLPAASSTQQPGDGTSKRPIKQRSVRKPRAPKRETAPASATAE